MFNQRYFFLIFFSNILLASPRLGDYSIMEFDLVGQTISIKKKILSFDLKSNLFKIEKTTYQNGSSEVKYEYLNSEKLNFENFKDVCLKDNAKLEVINVIAGKFEACLYIDNLQGQEMKTWISNVPFGVIRKIVMNQQPSQSYVGQLIEYGNEKNDQ